MENLINELIVSGVLKTPNIIAAFKKIQRRDFLPSDSAENEGLNAPILIGFGQTNSQPLTVAFMMELLQPKTGESILDVGSGSGWTSALLAEIVGKSGKIYAIELIPELKERSEQNCQKYNFTNIKFISGDGSKGLPNYAPFDRIHVAAAAKEVPFALLRQLKDGGTMVIPTRNNDIKQITKKNNYSFDEKVHPGFVFVPLIEN